MQHNQRMGSKMANPHERLRHHVTGAIERGEKEPIVEQRAPLSRTPYELGRLAFIMDSSNTNTCPFRSGTDAFNKWFHGWLDAKANYLRTGSA